MTVRITLIAIMLLTASSYADQVDSANNQIKITTRLSFSYVPIGSIEFTNRDVKYDIYDNLAYRVSVEYHLSELVSLGPGFECLKKNVNPDGTFNDDIVQYNFYLDCRFNHCLTDSSENYLVFGVGTGISNLKEMHDENGNNFCLYGDIGLDISLHKSVGLDLLYRFQTNKITVDDRIYRFNGSALQAGLNYRFKF
jgi:hypothetical protein